MLYGALLSVAVAAWHAGSDGLIEPIDRVVIFLAKRRSIDILVIVSIKNIDTRHTPQLLTGAA